MEKGSQHPININELHQSFNDNPTNNARTLKAVLDAVQLKYPNLHFELVKRKREVMV